MQKLRIALLAAALMAGIAPVKAQQFNTIPSNTVIGRFGNGVAGPASAISMSLLAQSGLNGLCQTNNAFPVYSSSSIAWVCSTAPSANTVYAGPSTGSAAQPAFRALVGADLPLPSASTLGGIQSIVSLAHNWIAYIDTSGVPHQAQPAFSDLSSNIAVSQMNSGSNAGATTYWRGDATWQTAVSSAQISAGSGVSVSTTAGANPCITTCNLTVAANNSMGANKIQVFATAGSSGTITTPTGAAWAKFTLVGGGASGTGSGTASGGQGSAGGNTCINTSGSACTSPVYQAAGGGQPSTWGGTGNGGTGGTCSGSGTFLLSVSGGDGGGQAGNGSIALPGPPGGASGLGFGHGGAAPKGANGASGSGFGGGGQGGGVSATASSFTGPAGGGGAGCVAFIQSPAASYTYAVANTTSGGGAGTNGFTGGAGSGGLIIAEFGFN